MEIEVLNGRDIAELLPLVRRLMNAIQYVPMRPADCNQSEVYELMDRINVILDVPQEGEARMYGVQPDENQEDATEVK